jgi:hypothetical protein
MRSFGKRVSVPWQIRLVIMSVISRWPNAIHRNALCAIKFWVRGGSDLACSHPTADSWRAARSQPCGFDIAPERIELRQCR